MTIGSCQKELHALLIKAGVESPGLCVSMLLEYVTGLTRLELALARDKKLSRAEYDQARLLADRRCHFEPMAYIIGYKDFYEHCFRVSPATLIPRPETELLVEIALEKAPYKYTRFLDAGCGCGNIGLSLLAARKHWQGLLLDKSAEALGVAQENAARMAAQAVFIQGDIFGLPIGEKSLDLLVSNPPYIGLQEKGEVMPDVLAFEPHSALFSSEHGLGHLKALASQAARILKDDGLLLMEHGASQQESLLEILAAHGFRDLSAYNDLAGLPRCVAAIKGH